MAKKDRKFRKKVLLSSVNGERCATVFSVDGKNKDARFAAECDASAEIKRMICEGGHEYHCSYYDDEIIKKN